MNKKLAKMSLLKLENFEKEVEFKELLVSSLKERFLSGCNFIYVENFVRIDLGLNEELIYEVGEFEKTLKDPFFKKILFETKKLDDDSRDIFYSIIFAIVLLSEDLFNRNLDEDEEDESLKDPEVIKEKISNKILELYKKDELESSLSIFDTEIEETVNYIVENILEYSGEEPSDYDYSGEDPFPVNFVAGMFDILTVYTVLKTNKELGEQVAFSYTGYNLETGWDNSIEFNFSNINPPTPLSVYSDVNKQPAFGLNQKKLAGKYFQFAMLSLIFSKCEPESYGYRKVQNATERFLSDEYLLSFLIDNVKKYQESDVESQI